MTISLIKRRIARHEKAAKQAGAKGDRERFWQERRAMLLAQATLYELTHKEGE